MLGSGAELPRPLGLQILVSGVHPVRRKLGDADEVIKVELRDGTPDGQPSMPAIAGLSPVDRQIGLDELERPVRKRVAADLEVREFIIHPAVYAERWRQVLADADIHFSALLLHRRVVEREVDANAGTVLIEGEELNRAVQSVQRSFGAGFERESRQVCAGPADAANRFVSICLDVLIETADDRPALIDQAVALQVSFRVVALSARREADELDCAAREG